MKNNNWLTSLVLFLAVSMAGFLFSGSFAEAAVPSGKYVFKIKASDALLWDVSGTYTEQLPGLGKISMTLVQKSNGQISGYGKATVRDSGVSMTMNFKFVGRVYNVGSVIKIIINMPLKGTATYQGQTVNFSGKATARMELNDNTDPAQLYGVIKVTITIPGYGSETKSMPFDMALINRNDGKFKVIFNLSRVGKTGLEGTGNFLLANKKRYIFSITGLYDVSSRKATLRLRDPKAKGFALTATVDKSGYLTGMRGYAGGQRLITRQSYQNLVSVR